MTLLKSLTAATLVAGAVVAAVPAQAVVVTFAQFQAIGNRGQTYWKNDGTNGVSNGSGGSIYTTSSPTATVPGSRPVSFSFLLPSISPYVTNVTANYTLFATVTNSPAILAGGQLIETGIAGGFSFVTTAPLVVGSTLYAAGSNLLSATFTNSTISGARLGTSAGYSSSGTQGLSLTYTSDFLTFDPAAANDFSISLTAITSALQAIPTNGNPNRALRNFRAFSTGSFSADPAPLVDAVPEPAVWGLMIVGFGMVGLQTRRRSRNASVAA